MNHSRYLVGLLTLIISISVFNVQARNVYTNTSIHSKRPLSAEFSFRQDIYFAQWSRLRHLAEMGDANAQFRLGNLYYSPPPKSGIRQSYHRAFQLFLASAKSGNPHSQHNLAVLYLKGQGVEQNQQKSLAWFLIAAENGSKSAKRTIAKFSRQHVQKTQSLKQDLEKQIKHNQFAK